MLLNQTADHKNTNYLQQNLGVEDVVSHAQLLGSLTSNQGLVTCDHLHQKTLHGQEKM